MRFLLYALSLCLAMPAMAADAASRQSLQRFFQQGVWHASAQAHLEHVLHWPKANGVMFWQLPKVQGFPKHLSLIAEQGERRWYVPVELSWWSQAVVSKHYLPKGSLLQANDVVQQEADVTAKTSAWFDRIEQTLGLRLQKDLPASTILQASMLKRPLLIHRGDVVIVEVKQGGLLVRSKAKAMRSACLGDSLWVRLLNNGKTVQAVVLNASTVSVSGGVE